jgi:hypothetical protein
VENGQSAPLNQNSKVPVKQPTLKTPAFVEFDDGYDGNYQSMGDLGPGPGRQTAGSTPTTIVNKPKPKTTDDGGCCVLF